MYLHTDAGHGGQSPDASGQEANGMDETIFPVDFDKEGDIIDDVRLLFQLSILRSLEPLPVSTFPSQFRCLPLCDSHSPSLPPALPATLLSIDARIAGITPCASEAITRRMPFDRHFRYEYLSSLPSLRVEVRGTQLDSELSFRDHFRHVPLFISLLPSHWD
jgi:hypothetical protein